MAAWAVAKAAIGAVAGVLDKPTIGFDRLAQYRIMRGQRDPHFLGLFLPAPRRFLDVREEEGHRPSRPRSHHLSPSGRTFGAVRLIVPDASNAAEENRCLGAPRAR